MTKGKKKFKLTFRIVEASNNNELNEKIIVELQKANRQNKKVAINKYCYAIISIS